MNERKICGPCEAEIHVVECNGRGSTTDHFTPKCIARILGWTHSKLNEPQNRQQLSTACHEAKDATTPKKAEMLREQLGGRMISFGEHI